MFRLSILVVLSLLVVGCAGGEPHPATPTPTSNFVARIDNPYLPLSPGTMLRYKGTAEEGPEELTVEVTRTTKAILGVPTVTVRHKVTRKGQVVEDVLASYAQDREGNVWYFGEDVKEYENGKVVSTKGSWEAGKDSARPGVMMRARPQVGDKYNQENYPGKAMDAAEVLSLTERASVPFGSFDKALMTKDSTPLEPAVADHKYYVRGVGLVLEVTVKGGNERRELIAVTR